MVSWLRVWLWAARPWSWSASIVPVLVGTALSAQVGTLHPLLFAVTLVCAVLIQVGTNLADEYFDHLRGVALKYPAPHKVIALGYLSPAAVRLGCYLSLAAASLLGLYLVKVAGWPILVIGIVSVLSGYYYSATPLVLGNLGLGEVLVFLLMGPVAVLGTYYVQVRAFSWEVLWVSLPVGFLVTAILLANNIRDREEDLAAGKLSLAVWLGRQPAGLLLGALVLGAFLLALGAVALGAQPLPLMATALALPKAVSVTRIVVGGADRSALHAAVRGTARLHWHFGLLLAMGLIATRVLHI